MEIIKDIAEYEETDSELAKFTICELHRKLNRYKKENNRYKKTITEALDLIHDKLKSTSAYTLSDKDIEVLLVILESAF